MGAAHDRLSLRTYGASRGSHSHDHFQVLFGMEGVLELEVEGRPLQVTAGDAVLVAPGDRHDFESRTGSLCLVLDSRRSLWTRCPSQPRDASHVGALAGYLAQALSRQQPAAALHGPALLLEAWSPVAAARRVQRPIDWHALAAWTQENLARPLTVADLAALVFLSPGQFAARCRQAQGVSPMEWLRLQRLERARQLRDGGMAVADAAQRTGYRSPSALTAALRRRTGH